jgi:hypothetical protein
VFKRSIAAENAVVRVNKNDSLLHAVDKGFEGERPGIQKPVPVYGDHDNTFTDRKADWSYVKIVDDSAGKQKESLVILYKAQ